MKNFGGIGSESCWAVRFVVELTVFLEKELKDTRLLLTTPINIQAN